jgi:two-component system, cell cycle sensor histidine kinase and response regulator CckA
VIAQAVQGRLRRRYVALAVLAAVPLGVLIGWWADVPALTTVMRDWPSMKPNTAAGFLLSIGGLALLDAGERSGRGQRWRSVGAALAGAATLIGLLTILEYAAHVDFGIDGLLMRHALAPGEVGVPGRPSGATAWGFVLLGGALLLLYLRRWLAAAEALLVTVVLVQAVAALGFAYGDLAIRQFEPFASVALHTALLFLALALLALWMRPEGGVMQLVRGPGLGGRMLRRMIPVLVLVLFGAGLLRTWGIGLGIYRPDRSEPVLVLGVFLLLVAALVQNARHLTRLEAERDRFFMLGGDLFCLIEVSGNFARVNQAFSRVLGWEAEDLASRPVASLIHPDDREATARELRRLAAGHRTESFENRVQTRAGDWRLVSWSASTGPNRKLIYAAGRDVTELHAAQEALRASEQHLAITLQSIGDGVIVTDGAGRVVRVNAAAERLTGWSGTDAQGRAVEEVFRIIHDETRQPAVVPVERVLRTGEVAGLANRTVLIARDGTERPIGDSAAPIRDASDALVGVVMVFRDVTAERTAERALRESNEELERRVEARAAALAASERKFSDLFEFAPDGIVIADATGHITMVNREAERLFGWTRAELIHQSVEVLVPESFRPDHIARRETYTADAAPHALRRDAARLRGVRKDGVEFPAEVTLSPMTRAGEQLIVAVVRDMTERAQLEAQFLHAQKLESVGQMAGAVAHDFNNLLTVINSVAEIVLSGLAEDDPRREDLATIHDTGWRAAELTRHLLAFSRRQVLQPRVINLNAVVRDLVPMLGRLLGEGIALATTLDDSLGNVRADPSQMEQVLMNFAVNARDAMPEGGRLTIETRNANLDETYVAGRPGVVPGAFVMLAVTDTGTGMSAETRARIFEPFFTTKGTGKGTGLGLSTVYGIVKQSGGDTRVYSEVGTGTTFRIYLPRVVADEDRPESIVDQPETRGHETVLVVEDEPSLRVLTKRILERFGYRVQTASNAAEALAALDRGGEAVDLLLTDLAMPGMSGRELAARVAEAHPRVRVLFTSGYADDMALQPDADPRSRFIAKPFSAADLGRIVRKVLDA